MGVYLVGRQFGGYLLFDGNDLLSIGVGLDIDGFHEGTQACEVEIVVE